jgi:radical SAM superfamily enzyme YgiQ (UPF0313 family)
MKNIYFIEAKSSGAHIFSKMPMPRLGSILLATILKEKGYNTKVFIEDIATPNWTDLWDADMICVSAITPTALQSYYIAKVFRNKIIVIGGPHSTFMPEESLEYADYAVRGEGEETIIELLEHLWGDRRPIDSIKGLSYKSKGEVVNNPLRDLIKNLNNAPIPDFGLVYKWENSKVVPVATSRGCPFACRFCSVIQMFGREYRRKRIKKIIEEIKAAAKEKRHMFFIDDNFAANKKRTKELLRAIIKKKIKFPHGWSAQVRTDVAKDPELLNLMEKAGCFALYIGFESFNPKTLKLYNKGQSVEDVENAIGLIKEHNIKIHGMFVLGADTDDVETIRNTQKLATKFDIDSIQFMILTPYPGTPVFEEIKAQGRLLHTDWGKYDAHHATFEPKLMTADELHVETLKAMGKFYSWRFILRNLLKLDFFYSFVGIYGKRTAKKSIKGSKDYLGKIGVESFNRLAQRYGNLKSAFGEKKIVAIIFNTDSSESMQNLKLFLASFFKKIGITTVIEERYRMDREGPVVMLTSASNYKTQQYRDIDYRKDSILKNNGITDSSFSFFKAIAWLLDIKSEKLRKAYDYACSVSEPNMEDVLILVKK